MTQLRTGRRRYYDIFSHFYDALKSDNQNHRLARKSS